MITYFGPRSLVFAIALLPMFACKHRGNTGESDEYYLDAAPSPSPLGTSISAQFYFRNGKEIESVDLKTATFSKKFFCGGSTPTNSAPEGRDTTKCNTADGMEVHVTRRHKEAERALSIVIWNKSRKAATMQWAYKCQDLDSSINNATCVERSAAPRKLAGKLASSISSTLPLDTTVPPLYPNLHLVGSSGANGAKLFRGMAPVTKEMVDRLRSLEIRHVLYFKLPSDNGEELTQEKDWFNSQSTGEPIEIVDIPFRWKSFPNFREPCEQTITALKSIRGALESGKSTMFHCTVGEDRTGYLAGIYRILTENSNFAEIFRMEMCERGYSAGNPLKPYTPVVAAVDDELTTVFAKMLYKIHKGQVTWQSLDTTTCLDDPSSQADFSSNSTFDSATYRCLSSSLFDP